jgi:signal transduction histidine kinase
MELSTRVIEAHHGRIWAEEASHGGQGTTMGIMLLCHVTPDE